ncbi:MAG: glutamate-5-semialdehyde dehydrogenase [Bacteroidales bacterium]
MTIIPLLQQARVASSFLSTFPQGTIDSVLRSVADAVEAESASLLEANKEDMKAFSESDPLYDRLLLTETRVREIAGGIRNVAALKSPVGEILSEATRPNGMIIRKVRVPLGVVGVIYEARPNVTFDVFSLCFKTANVCVLKGGSDAKFTNEKAAQIVRGVLEAFGVPVSAMTMLPPERETVDQMLKADGLIDVIIPRGSSGFIKFVRQNATVPIIETGAGIVHAYFDEYGDVSKGERIITNAKTRRVSVCNALDCLVIHKSRLDALGYLCSGLAAQNVTVFADRTAFEALSSCYPSGLLRHSDSTSFDTEFLDYKIAVKTAGSFNDAVEFISEHTSHHSESIITENKDVSDLFTQRIDSACVYVNLPTSFTDGAQFGFGAEIGISTQKLHARGPMGLPELTTYKYIITGDGQIRP